MPPTRVVVSALRSSASRRRRPPGWHQPRDEDRQQADGSGGGGGGKAGSRRGRTARGGVAVRPAVAEAEVAPMPVRCLHAHTRARLPHMRAFACHTRALAHTADTPKRRSPLASAATQLESLLLDLNRRAEQVDRVAARQNPAEPILTT